MFFSRYTTVENINPTTPPWRSRDSRSCLEHNHCPKSSHLQLHCHCSGMLGQQARSKELLLCVSQPPPEQGSTPQPTARPAELLLAAFAAPAKDSPFAPHIHSLTTQSKRENWALLDSADRNWCHQKGANVIHHPSTATAKKAETFNLG